jgi:hypothetical protein
MKKIALLFLTIDNHNQPKIWESFLKNNNYFNIYCHPKNPDKVTNIFLKSNIIKNLTSTNWGYLVLAYYELLKEAFKNKDNYKFMYLSDSCIPIKSAEYVYKILTKNNDTYIDTNIKISKFDIIERFKKHKKIYSKFGINENNFIKHSGWFVLNRQNSLFLLKNEKIFKYFNNVKSGDECLLSILKANKIKLTEKCVTCVKWEDLNVYSKYKNMKKKLLKIYNFTEDETKKKKILNIIKSSKTKMKEKIKHPKTYEKIKLTDIKEFNKKYCLFVRKVSPTTDISLISIN